jgi:hypothetical protein
MQVHCCGSHTTNTDRYKPCNSAKKLSTDAHAVTNEHLHALHETGPTHRKRRYATQDFVCGVLRSVDRSVRLGRLGVCPECLMAEVGKKLDYNGVRTTERWINTQGESACQALKRIGRQGLYKVCQRKRDEVQGLYKVCTERMYRGSCRGSTKYTTRTE